MASQVSDKEQKYDRQLRLWGADGQARLEVSKFCLLGAGPEGTETVKNLVLPGVGHFTIIDDRKVTENDLTNNFFVTASDLGKPRAEVVASLLHELNDDVQAVIPIVQNPAELIASDPSFVTKYSFIIATDLPEAAIIQLADACHKHKIALAFVRTYGWMCYLRLQFPSYPVIESKPDNTIPDLRMAVPFPELLEYANSFKMEELDGAEHAHVPFPVILIKAVQNWRKENKIAADVIPTPKDKAGILQALNALKRPKDNSANFEEAVKFAMRTYVPYRIPDEVESLLNDERALNLTASSPDFWISISALRQFRLNEGEGRYLPLIGIIPDMECESHTFAQIKNIYNHKFNSDVTALHKYVKKNLEAIGRDPESITFAYLQHLCRNGFALRSFTFRTLAEEYAPETAQREMAEMAFMMEPNSNLIWYYLLRAADRFRSQHGHYPCTDLAQDVSAELEAYTTVVHQIASEYSLPEGAIPANYIHEFARWGAGSLHNSAAILGGVAAQEIIKGVTQQWEPLNNTWIFNGLETTSNQYNL